MPDKGLKIPKNSNPGQPDRQNWLLVIGIDDYEHCHKLNNAVRDAKALRELLLDAYSFDDARVISLFDEEATRAGIWEAFSSLKEKIKEGDNLLIYFSGHGHFDKDSKLSYWVPFEGKTGQDWSFVNFDTLKSILKPLKVHHLLMVVDSCYSGAHFVTRDLGSAAPRLEKDPSRFMIASGRNEVVQDGDAGKNSPFAESLLRLLEEYRSTGVNTAELADKLTKNVAWNYTQTPIAEALDQLGHLGGQFVFHPRRNEARDWQRASEADTAVAYSSFIAAWPESSRLEEAHWKRASLLHTLQAYNQYLDTFPQGAWAEDAIDRIEEIEDDTRFEDARRLGQAGLRRFIRSYPDSRHIDAARKELQRLRAQVAEPEAWRIASNENSIPAYERYLSEYPEGAHVLEARRGIANIRQEIETRKQREQEEKARKEAEAKRLAEEKAHREAEAKRRAEEAEKRKAVQEERKRERRAASWWKKPPAIAGGLVLLALLLWGMMSLLKPAPRDQIVPQNVDTSTFIEPPMVHVQGGSFTMGSPENEEGRDDNEDQHRETVGSFYMGKYEVTQREWVSVMGSNPSLFKCNNCPVENVSWEDAQKYIRKLNQLTGKRYRLPTEAEWEYAARGGNKSNGYIYAGSNTLGSVGWYDDNSGSKTHPVGQKRANELGLYDMSGNVWEWCQDWYTSGSSRVMRGGSWFYYSRSCRVANRNDSSPSYRDSSIGFRLSRNP